MTSAFYRYSNPLQSIRSMAQTTWTSGLLFPSWKLDAAYLFSAGVIQTTPLSGTVEFGYPAAASDAASGAWTITFPGALTHYTSGGALTFYSPGSGALFTGLTTVTSGGLPFIVDASGYVYGFTTGLSGDVLSVSDIFSLSDIFSIAASGGLQEILRFPVSPQGLVATSGALYTILAALSGVGAVRSSGFTESFSSGFVATPMQFPTCLAASGSLLAVGGWNPATIASGFSAIATNPTDNSLFVGITPSASALTLWHNSDGLGNWTLSQTVTGVAAATALAWSPLGNTIFSASPTSGVVQVFNYAFGTVTKTQTIALSGAAAVAFTLNALNALVCQPTQNVVTPLTLSGSAWVASGSLAIHDASSVLALSNVEAMIGFASGAVVAQYAGGVWSSGAVTALSFVPTQLTQDLSGNLIAAGTSGSSGFVYTTGVTGSFNGSVSGLLYRQDQIVIADGTNALLRVFSLNNGTLTQKTSLAVASPLTALAAPPLADPLAYSVPVIAAASGVTSLVYFYSPFTLAYQKSNEFSLYNGSAWTSTQLKIGHQPEALTFDPSGNVSLVTLQNELFTMSATGGIVSSGVIAQFSGQPQTSPLGLSSLQWINGSLFATSVLNETLVQLE